MPSDDDLPRLGILYDPYAKFSPSNHAAIQKFKHAGHLCGFEVEVIGLIDFIRLSAFDALLIRDTTARNNYTYDFSLSAKILGIPCIDDVYSIINCTNKIYMHTHLNMHNIRTPKTVFNPFYLKSLDGFQFPLIFKEIDSCFSRGVHKINDFDDLNRFLTEMHEKPETQLIMQEYVPTEFDWRIGVIDGAPLFACKYYMSKNDWRIIKYDRSDNYCEGDHKTIPLSKVPPEILQIAVKASNSIGNGLYGVDIKVFNGKILVIEVNDNPSIDAGVEDEIYENELYYKIVKYLYYKVKGVTR